MGISSKKRILFLINIRSGGKRALRVIRALNEYARSENAEIQVEELSYERSVIEAAKLTGAEIVVIGGGDGTFSTLLPQLAALRMTIGFLPLGTGNDLARELGLIEQLRCDEAARLVEFYRTAPCRDVAYFNLEYGERFSSKTSFINYVSFGFDAKVVAGFARLRGYHWWRYLRGVWGNRLGYAGASIFHSMNKIVSNPAFTIKNVRGTTTFKRAKSIIFANIKSIMGMGKSNLHSSAFDENVECVAVPALMNYLTMLSHYRLPLFHPRFLGSASQWELSDLPSGVHVQVDGEPRPDIQSGRFRIEKGGALSMVVGPRCEEK